MMTHMVDKHPWSRQDGSLVTLHTKCNVVVARDHPTSLTARRDIRIRDIKVMRSEFLQNL